VDVVVIGGTGFIGAHLIDSLLADDRIGSVRLLTRDTGRLEFSPRKKLAVITGDVLNKAVLRELIVENSVVVNLAYLSAAPASRNLELIDHLLVACREKGANKLIHCSTAVVSGRTFASPLTESSALHPFSDYERTKLMLENRILDLEAAGFERIIVRPTAVFGPGGKNLLQLANDLCSGSVFKNYLKSCLYGSRTMNLVSVENVVSALRFLIFRDPGLDRRIFIVADDDHPHNNFAGIESALIRALGIKPYPVPRISVPRWVLSLLLRLLRQANIDPQRRYSSSALEQLGWRKQADFDARIEDFARWFMERHQITRGQSL
jgi:nucleoside-diphosphate-sugar epimerase